MSPETFQMQGPVIDKKMVFITAKAAVNNDFITLTTAGSGITTIEGVYLVSTTGVIGTFTWSGLVITVTNAGALQWHGFAWGI